MDMAINTTADGVRLLAPGAPITIQGEARRVHFGMASLLYLEGEYGGLDAFWAHLNESGFGKTRINTIFEGMVAGLLETKPEEQDLDVFKGELLRALEPKDMLVYLQAVVNAFIESIPSFEVDSVPKANGSRASSHGRGSTSTRRSATGAPTASSGA